MQKNKKKNKVKHSNDHKKEWASGIGAANLCVASNFHLIISSKRHLNKLNVPYLCSPEPKCDWLPYSYSFLIILDKNKDIFCSFVT